ncbi:hypothetical protein B0T25DRAFT_551014 [Lasiosphaeria hispida]|uniref:Uncharacterized protein n=1 Tax=Lasiosphaeria hispida TaxID=260671 RepID=A0AAJ0HAP8_9PEZI|nr:hypothetical protein B0T25DRAFT_551014 [Lasiosphaeria hispida]
MFPDLRHASSHTHRARGAPRSCSQAHATCRHWLPIAPLPSTVPVSSPGSPEFLSLGIFSPILWQVLHVCMWLTVVAVSERRRFDIELNHCLSTTQGRPPSCAPVCFRNFLALITGRNRRLYSTGGCPAGDLLPANICSRQGLRCQSAQQVPKCCCRSVHLFWEEGQVKDASQPSRYLRL